MDLIVADMKENYTFAVSGYAESWEEAREVADRLYEELKDKLWVEVWRKEIDLPECVVESERLEDGRLRIVVRLLEM